MSRLRAVAVLAAAVGVASLNTEEDGLQKLSPLDEERQERVASVKPSVIRRSIVRSEGTLQRQDANPASIVELGELNSEDPKDVVIDKDASLEDVRKMRKKTEEYIEALKAKARTLAADEAFRKKLITKEKEEAARAAQEAKQAAEQMAEEAAKRAEKASQELNETISDSNAAPVDVISANAGAGVAVGSSEEFEHVGEHPSPQEVALQTDMEAAARRTEWLNGVMKRFEAKGAEGLKDVLSSRGSLGKHSLQQDGENDEKEADAVDKDMVKELKSKLESVAESKRKSGLEDTAPSGEKSIDELKKNQTEAEWEEEMAQRWDARQQRAANSSSSMAATLGDPSAQDFLKSELAAWLKNLQQNEAETKKKWQVWIEKKQHEESQPKKQAEQNKAEGSHVSKPQKTAAVNSHKTAGKSKKHANKEESPAARKAAEKIAAEQKEYRKKQERQAELAAKLEKERQEVKAAYEKKQREVAKRAEEEKNVRDELARKAKEKQLRKAKEAEDAKAKADQKKAEQDKKKAKHSLEEVDEEEVRSATLPDIDREDELDEDSADMKKKAWPEENDNDEAAASVATSSLSQNATESNETEASQDNATAEKTETSTTAADEASDAAAEETETSTTAADEASDAAAEEEAEASRSDGDGDDDDDNTARSGKAKKASTRPEAVSLSEEDKMLR